MATSSREIVTRAFLAEKIVERMKNEPGCSKFVSVSVHQHKPDALGVDWSVDAAECGVPHEVYAAPLARVVHELQARYRVGEA